MEVIVERWEMDGEEVECGCTIMFPKKSSLLEVSGRSKHQGYAKCSIDSDSWLDLGI